MLANIASSCHFAGGKMDIRRYLGHALRAARRSKGLIQEDFSVTSSTNLISLIENGKTSPTLQKLEDICVTLQAHPLSVMALAYLLEDSTSRNPDELLAQVRQEVGEMIKFREGNISRDDAN